MLVQNYINGMTSVNIAASIEQAITAGKIAAGALLPTVRLLSTHLQVSPATVYAAYRLLQDRGVVVTDGRRGTRVRQASPIVVPPETRDRQSTRLNSSHL